MPFKPNREELAWAAGFFDGEGSFSWTEPAAFGCAVINQTNRESLERFKGAVAGLGKIYGPYEPRHKDRWSRKPQWAFRAHRREHVQAIAVMLWFKLDRSRDGKRSPCSNVIRTSVVADIRRITVSPAAAVRSGRLGEEETTSSVNPSSVGNRHG